MSAEVAHLFASTLERGPLQAEMDRLAAVAWKSEYGRHADRIMSEIDATLLYMWYK